MDPEPAVAWGWEDRPDPGTSEPSRDLEITLLRREEVRERRRLRATRRARRASDLPLCLSCLETGAVSETLRGKRTTPGPRPPQGRSPRACFARQEAVSCPAPAG